MEVIGGLACVCAQGIIVDTISKKEGKEKMNKAIGGFLIVVVIGPPSWPGWSNLFQQHRTQPPSWPGWGNRFQ